MVVENTVENVDGMLTRIVDEKYVQNLLKNPGNYAELPRNTLFKTLWKT